LFETKVWWRNILVVSGVNKGRKEKGCEEG